MADTQALDTPRPSAEELAALEQEAATLPRVFGSYTLLKMLARGALGNVYLAITGPQVGFERLCVIKRVRPELSAEGRFVDVFRREAEDLVHLNHGNIAQVFDIGTVGEESYLALEYVEGKDFRALLKRGRSRQKLVPPDVALYTIGEVLAGLDYAHRRPDAPGRPPMVHNDVCPENILVSYHGEVKLVDFGTAKATVLHRDTFQALMPEKAYYMSPEQVKAPSQPDLRTDVFSTGVVLWELLSGKRPHDLLPFDAHFRALSAGRVNLPALPDALAESEALDAIVRRATAADRNKRYRSAAEFRAELTGVLGRLNARIGPDRIAGFARELFGAEIDHEHEQVQKLLGIDLQSVRDAARETLPHTAAVFQSEERTVIRRAVTRALGPQEQVAGVIPGTRYRIVRRIGEGAMGVVYAAEHVDLEKMVAIKVLHEDFSTNAEFVARFRQEARAASKVGHPHIVDVTDFGETEDGRLFFAMEYLEGQSLAQLMAATGPLPVDRAGGIALQICDALGAAHKKGIVHRDLKPENVFVLTRDANDFVKILDFGIAKEAPKKGGPRLTQQGSIFGTPHYMAPEQATGLTVDHRADVYSLGNLLYEMVTGTTPFVAGTAVEVLTMQIKERPQPPCERAPDLHIPATIDAIIMQALEKKPDERYQSMEEVADALIAALTTVGSTGALQIAPTVPSKRGEESGVQQEIDGVWNRAMEEAEEPAKRRPLLWIGVPLALGLVVGGIFVWGSSTGRSASWMAGLKAMFGVGETASLGTDSGVPAAAEPHAGSPGSSSATPAAGDRTGPSAADRTAATAVAALPSSTIPSAAPAIEDEGANVPAASAISRAAAARSDAAVRRAQKSLRRRQAAAAEASFREALAANPRNVDAAGGLSELLLDRGQNEEAARVAVRGLRVSPNSTTLRTNLGRAYYRLERFTDAIGEWRKVLQRSPRDRQVRRFVAQAQAAQQKNEKRR